MDTSNSTNCKPKVFAGPLGVSARKFRIYIHIPFCMKKCLYCDFLSWSDSKANHEKYAQALCREIRFYQGSSQGKAVSLFFGGGTPSVLDPSLLGNIMDSVNAAFFLDRQAEITIEANPGTVTPEKLREYRRMGINRISFGLQSAQDEELVKLGRIHTYGEFLEGYQLARDAGFANINVDLMSGIPGQTYASWLQSLSRVLELRPEHISAYSLIVEEGTPFARMELELPGEEEERQMYECTAEVLGRQGYRQYEISNYALPGRECAHNRGYWLRDNYLGLGLGAASLMGNRRWKNTEAMEDYLKYSGNPRRMRIEQETLSRREQMGEFMILGLRMADGVSREDFQEEFGIPMDEVYGNALIRQEKLGLLKIAGGRVSLTRKGISLSNQVFVELL